MSEIFNRSGEILIKESRSKFKISIGKMRLTDIAEVQRIEREEHLVSWSFEGYADEIKNTDSICLVAKWEKETVGFLIARLIIQNNCAEIYNIAVRREFKRNKAATRLFKHIYKACHQYNLSEIWLEVRTNNKAAQNFYQKEGFTGKYIRKSFYINPTEDAIVMYKHLSAEKNISEILD